MNCEIRSRWLNWRGEHLSLFWWKAKVSGLWSVRMVKCRASSKCRKYLTASYIACSSLSCALCFCCARLSFLEKKERGCQTYCTRCWRTAPMAVVEASVTSAREAVGSG